MVITTRKENHSVIQIVRKDKILIKISLLNNLNFLGFKSIVTIGL